jgi:L-ribulose-5-phosphate 3-epimerase
MRLGYNTNGFAHHRLEDALTILAELGYQSVAITLDHHALNPFDTNSAQQCERIDQLLAKLQLRCVIETGARFLLDPRRKHQPTLLSSGTADRQRRFDFLCRGIDIAQRLRADAVSFWSGAPDSARSETELLALLTAECNRLCDYAETRNVRLAFEPEPGMFIDTMARYEELELCVSLPNFGLTLDLGHLHCLGELPIAPHLERWKDRLWNIHIEDMRRGVHDHLMFGEGDMDFPPIFDALRRINYQGGIHVELSRHSHDAVETARRALTFLCDL